LLASLDLLYPEIIKQGNSYPQEAIDWSAGYERDVLYNLGRGEYACYSGDLLELFLVIPFQILVASEHMQHP
jgi:hypothetical protein